jgi:trans-aconitate 2-methyltransferase
MIWSPDQYLKYADHRLRPALDLLARIDVERPSRVFDLGCGPGNVTEWLLRRWPDADYLHRLEGEDAVLQWMLGTTLRPLLAALSAAWRDEFLADYGRRLQAAYPREPDGSRLFPFRRLFIVASRPL